MKLVLTCEHAFNTIPPEYQNLFTNARETLKSHRGYDPGALDLFYELKDLSDFSFFHETGRLLVEVNRSKGHSNLFSISGFDRKANFEYYRKRGEGATFFGAHVYSKVK